jgi:hypothetical protein
VCLQIEEWRPGLMISPPSQVLRVNEHLAVPARHPNFDPARPWTGGWALLRNSTYAGNGTFVIAMAESDLPPEPTDWTHAKLFSFPGKPGGSRGHVCCSPVPADRAGPSLP